MKFFKVIEAGELLVNTGGINVTDDCIVITLCYSHYNYK